MEFRPGDLVAVNHKYASGYDDVKRLHNGSTGTVAINLGRVGVEWEHGSFVGDNGHNLDGVLPSSRGWWVYPEYLVMVRRGPRHRRSER